MDLKTYNINLDIKSKRNPKRTNINLIEGDVGTVLNITVLDNKVPLDLTGSTITISYKKVDNTSVVTSGEVLDATKGICKIEVHGQALSCPGLVVASVQIIDSDSRITTSHFAFNVLNQVVDDDDITSTDDFPILHELITDVQTMQDHIIEVGGDVLLSEDVSVIGINVGGISEGDVFEAGTNFTSFVKALVQKTIPPTYLSPTLSLSGNGSKDVEVGTNLTLTLTPTFNQRDGGNETNYELRKNGMPIYTNPTSQQYSPTTFQIGDESISYQATSDYDNGPIKNDNMGNPHPAGQVLASSVDSGTVTYRGQRKMFYGVDTSTIRSLGNNLLNPYNGINFSINVPSGTTKIIFAYPSTLRDVASVKYVELGNADVTSTFTLSTSSVEGANSFTAIEYKVYTYTSAIPFGNDATYEVTI